MLSSFRYLRTRQVYTFHWNYYSFWVTNDLADLNTRETGFTLATPYFKFFIFRLTLPPMQLYYVITGSTFGVRRGRRQSWWPRPITTSSTWPWRCTSWASTSTQIESGPSRRITELYLFHNFGNFKTGLASFRCQIPLILTQFFMVFMSYFTQLN